MKWSYNPPRIVKNIFNDFIWETNNQKVLITFDDGPNPNSTEEILKILSEFAIKSVFFCVGENLERYPELVKDIISEGHTIGNHTYKHQKINIGNENNAYESIKKVQDIALNKFNYKIEYFRPPHGRFNLKTNRILNKLSLKNVMWSLLTYDYKNDINMVKFSVQKYLMNNSIVVLHDSNKSKEIIIDSIKEIIESINKNNFKIGMPSECLK
ncbi:MAG: hypothetical protein CR986_07450 [Ignavibacteriae bacterium]|nr:MAG: hypothetical protein CR986_07450 [Ignavibacteriota bacterium]